MEKKLLTSAIASAVALSATMPADAKGPNHRSGLDNVLDEASCWGDEVDGFTASWIDPNTAEEQGTKYGGDLEVDAWLHYSCDFDETEADGTDGFSGMESAIVDVDLSNNVEDPFYYDCEATGEGEAVECGAMVTWEDVQAAADEAAEERFGGEAEECSTTIEACETVYSCEDGDTLFQEEGNWLCETGEEPYDAEATEECEEVTVDGNFSTSAELHPADGGSVFSVKEMNPGKGRGRQNYEKAYATCEWTDVSPE